MKCCMCKTLSFSADDPDETHLKACMQASRSESKYLSNLKIDPHQCATVCFLIYMHCLDKFLYLATYLRNYSS